ncbi:MAG TPA: YfiR family protein [Thermoanaerobaculia bacterium]|nr:YfiR family protein [Thermoanaerobaculia bacterium]
MKVAPPPAVEPEGRLRRLARGLSGLLALGCALAAGAAPPVETSRATGAPDFEIKAAFVVKFAKFVEWPAESPAMTEKTLNVCLIGEDTTGEALKRIAARTKVDERPVLVRTLSRAEDARSCAIVYVGSSETERLRPLLSILGKMPILTVGDAEGFAGSGGTIGFYVAEDKVRLEINPDAAAASGLKLSSQLLQLARLVRPGAKEKRR